MHSFFLSRAPTHYSFTFNSRFLYELKHKVRLSKSVCGIFHFRFRHVFIKVYFFVQQKAWTLWLYNVIICFKIKIRKKSHIFFLPDLWSPRPMIFKLQQEVWKLNDVCVSWSSSKTDLDMNFLVHLKLKFWVRLFLSMVSFK